MLDTTEAQRLARLRVLLADARRRATDRSDLGEHIAVVALDGVGELAIGLCMHKRGMSPRQRESLPEILGRLLEDLGVADPPGAKGFRELHRMRNLVQHEGVLPSPDQLPLWFDETERLVEFLVDASFGVRLGDVSSAAGVRNDLLRAGLEEVLTAVEGDDPVGSFERARALLDEGGKLLRARGLRGSRAALGQLAYGVVGPRPSPLDDALKQLAKDQELAAFSAEPAEWLWFDQRFRESRDGPAPSAGESRRALAFVTAWVMRLDSYLARHEPGRWEAWHAEQHPPVTGVPGGPHITGIIGVQPRSVVRQQNALSTDVQVYEWTLQLSDVPDRSEPSYSWAIETVARELDDERLTHVYLDRRGELKLSASKDVEPVELLKFLRRAIALSQERLVERAAQDEARSQDDAAVLEPFRLALSERGVPVSDLSVVRPEGLSGERDDARVRIRADRSDRGTSWFAVGLKETGKAHLGDLASHIEELPLGFDDVTVPTTWPPQHVACWIQAALAFDDEHHSQFLNERERDEARRRDLQRQFELLILDRRAPGQK